MYYENEWIPEFLPGDIVKTKYNTIKVVSIHQEQIYNVEVAGDHGVHTAKMTENFLRDMKNEIFE